MVLRVTVAVAMVTDDVHVHAYYRTPEHQIMFMPLHSHAPELSCIHIGISRMKHLTLTGDGFLPL